ncbi:hypothetical protein V8E53_003166 [Lactarius tabidus]|jgi:hypothetical protein
MKKGTLLCMILLLPVSSWLVLCERESTADAQIRTGAQHMVLLAAALPLSGTTRRVGTFYYCLVLYDDIPRYGIALSNS